MRKSRRTAEEMFPLVEQYLQSGQTRKAFCAAHGISASQLHYWQGKYPRKGAVSQGAAFLEISAPAAGERAVMEVVYPGEVRLRLFVPASATFLRSLLPSEVAPA